MADEVHKNGGSHQEIETIGKTVEHTMMDLPGVNVGLIGDNMVRLVRSMEMILRVDQCPKAHTSISDTAMLKSKLQNTRCMKCMTDDIVKLLDYDWKNYLQYEKNVTKARKVPQTRASKVRRLLKVWALVEQEARNHVLKGKANAHVNAEAIGTECMKSLLEKWSLIEREGKDGKCKHDDVDLHEELRAVMFPNSVKDRIEEWLHREKRYSLRESEDMAGKITKFVTGNIANSKEHMTVACGRLAEPHAQEGRKCDSAMDDDNPRAKKTENKNLIYQKCVPGHVPNEEVDKSPQHEDINQVSAMEAVNEFTNGYVCGVVFAAQDILKKGHSDENIVSAIEMDNQHDKSEIENDLKENVFAKHTACAMDQEFPDNEFAAVDQEEWITDFADHFVHGILVATKNIFETEAAFDNLETWNADFKEKEERRNESDQTEVDLVHGSSTSSHSPNTPAKGPMPEKTADGTEGHILEEILSTVHDNGIENASGVSKVDQEEPIKLMANDFVNEILAFAENVKIESDCGIDKLHKEPAQHNKYPADNMNMALPNKQTSESTQQSSMYIFLNGCLEGVTKAHDIARKEEWENFMKINSQSEVEPTGKVDAYDIVQSSCALQDSLMEYVSDCKDNITESDSNVDCHDIGMIEYIKCEVAGETMVSVDENEFSQYDSRTAGETTQKSAYDSIVDAFKTENVTEVNRLEDTEGNRIIEFANDEAEEEKSIICVSENDFNQLLSPTSNETGHENVNESIMDAFENVSNATIIEIELQDFEYCSTDKIASSEQASIKDTFVNEDIPVSSTHQDDDIDGSVCNTASQDCASTSGKCCKMIKDDALEPEEIADSRPVIRESTVSNDKVVDASVHTAMSGCFGGIFRRLPRGLRRKKKNSS